MTVADATPLIALARIGAFSLLKDVLKAIGFPPAVTRLPGDSPSPRLAALPSGTAGDAATDCEIHQVTVRIKRTGKVAPERIIDEVLALPPSERAELAHLLIASLDEGADPDAEAAWDAELQHRVEEIESGTAEGEPADEVFDKLRQKYS